MKTFFKALGITLLIALCVIAFYATLFFDRYAFRQHSYGLRRAVFCYRNWNIHAV